MPVGWEIPRELSDELKVLLLAYVPERYAPEHAYEIVRGFLNGMHVASNSGVALLSAVRDEPVFRLGLALTDESDATTAVVAAIQEAYGMMGRRFSIAIESEGVLQLRLSSDATQTAPTWRDHRMFTAWLERLKDQEFGGRAALRDLAAVLVQSGRDSSRVVVSTDPSAALWTLTALLLRGEPDSAAAEVLRGILDRYERRGVTLLIGGKRQARPI